MKEGRERGKSEEGERKEKGALINIGHSKRTTNN